MASYRSYDGSPTYRAHMDREAQSSPWDKAWAGALGWVSYHNSRGAAAVDAAAQAAVDADRTPGRRATMDELWRLMQAAKADHIDLRIGSAIVGGTAHMRGPAGLCPPGWERHPGRDGWDDLIYLGPLVRPAEGPWWAFPRFGSGFFRNSLTGFGVGRLGGPAPRGLGMEAARQMARELEAAHAAEITDTRSRTQAMLSR